MTNILHSARTGMSICAYRQRRDEMVNFESNTSTRTNSAVLTRSFDSAVWS